MKVLVINGSPKGAKSNTLKLTNAFVEGLQTEQKCDVTVFHVCLSENIHPCTGCFSCWTTRPGECIFSDDMPLEEYLEADLIIWSFPLYYFSMPSPAKLVMDRLLPLLLPNIQVNENGQCYHPSRYQIPEKMVVLISTCGFYQITGNYEAILAQFTRLYKDKLTSILCPQGELLGMPELSERTEEYLEYVRRAGEEYLSPEGFSAETQSLLAEPLFTTEAFLEMANAHWDIAGAEGGESKGLRLLKQMSAIYNKKHYTTDITLEICFNDTEEVFQLEISKDKCVVKTSDFNPYTTRIDTTLGIWQDISRKKLDGAQAIMDGLYTVSGSFETMHELDNLFSTRTESPPNAGVEKRTNMLVLLLPFILFWVVFPLSAFWGSIATSGGCVISLSLYLKYKFCVYDYFGLALAAGLAVLGVCGVIPELLLTGSYLVFAMLWGGSCLLKIPLTAYYAINDYPKNLFHNPIFLKTNRILTLIWSFAYLIATGIIYGLTYSGLSSYTGIITSVMFGLMGYFTKWFKNYYPAYVAGGKKNRNDTI